MVGAGAVQEHPKEPPGLAPATARDKRLRRAAPVPVKAKDRAPVRSRRARREEPDREPPIGLRLRAHRVALLPDPAEVAAAVALALSAVVEAVAPALAVKAVAALPVVAVAVVVDVAVEAAVVVVSPEQTRSIQ